MLGFGFTKGLSRVHKLNPKRSRSDTIMLRLSSFVTKDAAKVQQKNGLCKLQVIYPRLIRNGYKDVGSWIFSVQKLGQIGCVIEARPTLLIAVECYQIIVYGIDRSDEPNNAIAVCFD